MQILLEKEPALEAHLFARLVVLQIIVAQLDQVGEIVLHVDEVLAVDQGRVEYVSVARGDDARADSEVVNKAVAEIALARQVDADARPGGLFKKVHVADLCQATLEPEIILRPE